MSAKKLKKPATREVALEELTALLDDIKKIHTDSVSIDCEMQFPMTNEDYQAEAAEKAWQLTREWKLRRELVTMKNRDFVLMYAPAGYLPPRNPRKLLKLACYHGKWSIVLSLERLLKLKDLTLLLRGLIAGYAATEIERQQKEMVVALIPKKFPRFDKASAKLAVVSDYVEQFYPAIQHFGPSLYHWSKTNDWHAVKYVELTKMGCPADEKALKKAVKRTTYEITREIIKLGAVVSPEMRELVHSKFRHWWIMSPEELARACARYGVDPATLGSQYPLGSADEAIRKWLRMLHGTEYGCSWQGDKTFYLRVAAPCMARILEAEPEVARRLTSS